MIAIMPGIMPMMLAALITLTAVIMMIMPVMFIAHLVNVLNLDNDINLGSGSAMSSSSVRWPRRPRRAQPRCRSHRGRTRVVDVVSPLSSAAPKAAAPIRPPLQALTFIHDITL